MIYLQVFQVSKRLIKKKWGTGSDCYWYGCGLKKNIRAVIRSYESTIKVNGGQGSIFCGEDGTDAAVQTCSKIWRKYIC